MEKDRTCILQQIFAPIQTEMKALQTQYEHILHYDNPSIDRMLSPIVHYQGKQLRPAMVFLAAGINGEINPLTHTTALVIELLHCSSLVHDDVIDNAQRRHNQPTLNMTWNNRTAVLLGDYLLSTSMKLLIQTENQQLLTPLTEVAQMMIQGELLQLAQTDTTIPSEKEYMHIIDCKTAYLIATCFAMGTASCHPDTNRIEQWRSFGRKVGVIFQLKDDLLDYDKDITSTKDAYKDIMEHKITLPFIAALRQTPPNEQQLLWDLYKTHAGTKKEIQLIIDHVTDKGGIAYTESVIAEQVNQCVGFMNRQTNSDYKDALLALLQFSKERKF
jgi:octaprenyl-diphosphate synthase